VKRKWARNDKEMKEGALQVNMAQSIAAY